MGAGLLPNGNSESGPPKSDLVNGTVVKGGNAIPNWRTSGFVEYIESGHKQGDMLLVVPQGAHAVRLGNEASIAQRLRGAVPGVSVLSSMTAGSGAAAMTAQASVIGTLTNRSGLTASHH